MQVQETEAYGPLQMKIAILLRDQPLCGVDIMKRLNINSPGTIYPVLEILTEKGFINYELEVVGSVRKKIYSLTKLGERKLKEQLSGWLNASCINWPTCSEVMLPTIKDLVSIKSDEKVLCTVAYDDVKRFLRDAEVTYSYDLEVEPGSFDIAISFLGVGCLLGRRMSAVSSYTNLLYRSLRRGGRLVIIETEKSDNIFTRIVFEDMIGLKEPAGLTSEELQKTLRDQGFQKIRILRKQGLLYGTASKN
jgi:DNA-binding PadR family transcriptional regulator